MINLLGDANKRHGGRIEVASYLAWIVAAAVDAVACDFAADSYVAASLGAASERNEWPTASPPVACEQADSLRASLELASLSLTLLTF